MDWMINVIVPAITIIFYIAIGGTLLFFIGRFFYRLWSQKVKFIFRYVLFRQSYYEQMVKACLEYIDRGWSDMQVKTHLLKNDFTFDDIYDVLYVYNKLKNEIGIKDVVKGGNMNNDRKFKGSTSKS